MNALCNDQAMVILADASERLRGLGLYSGHGSHIPMPGSDMAAVLYLSTSQRALDLSAAGNLLAVEYAETDEGRKHFDQVVARQDDLATLLMQPLRPRDARSGIGLGLALACAAGTACANPAWQQCLVVGIADGDTLTVRCGTSGHYQQLRVRLAGIDAPEKRQPYGERARQALADLTFRRSARMDCASTDRYGRNICTVWITQDAGEQIDVGQALIERGMAWWYRAYARAQPAPQRRRYERPN
jgi:endonuclease YncB( thermonuclease family)